MDNYEIKDRCRVWLDEESMQYYLCLDCGNAFDPNTTHSC